MLSSSDRFEELTAILSAEMNPRSFNVLLGLIDSWPNAEEQSQAVSIAHHSLWNWPDSTRRVRASWHTISQVLNSQSWTLVRHLDLIMDERPENGKIIPEVITNQALNVLHGLELRGTTDHGVGGFSGGLMTGSELRSMLQSASLSGLSQITLQLEQSRDVHNAIRELLVSGRFAQLTRLALIGVTCDVVALLKTHWPKRLEDLQLYITEEPDQHSFVIPRTGREAASTICELLDVANGLKSLSLEGCPLGDEGVSFLVSHPNIPQLQCLNLSRTDCGLHGIISLLRSKVVKSICDLNLSGNELGGVGWQEFGELKESRLARLDLSDTFIVPDDPQEAQDEDYDAAVERLCQSSGLKWLVYVHLDALKLGRTGASALATATFSKDLTELRVTGLTEEGLIALCRFGKFQALQSLEIGGKLGPGSMQELARTSWSANLRKLTVLSSPVGSDGIRAIAESSNLGNLEELNCVSCNLISCNLMSEGLSLNSPGDCRLRHLDLSFNSLQPHHIEMLVQSSVCRNLWTLSLVGNYLGDEGAFVIAKSSMLSRLNTINIMLCQIKERGIAAICNSKGLHLLREIVHEELPHSNVPP